MGATTIPREKTGTTAAAEWKPELHQIPIDAIDVGTNVRRDVVDVDELAESIRSVGILSPIRVEESGAGRYALVYGQRRLAAAKVAGMATVPALVDASNRTGTVLIVAQLIENLQRRDLNPLEEAAALRQLLDSDGKMTQATLAKQIGRSAPYVSNALRLLKLGDPIKEAILDGRLSGTAGRAIASLPPAEATELARRAETEKLSTHQLEEQVRLSQQRATAIDRQRDENRKLADAAEGALGKKKAATKADAKLRVYDSNLRDELAKRGWTIVDRTLGYQKPKGCDCPAWEISRNYMGGNQTGVTITGACVVQAHVDAAAKVAEEERVKRNAEYEAAQEKRQQAERDEHAKAAAPVIDRLTADPEIRGRVLLWCLAQGSWGVTADAFEEVVEGEPDWKAIAALPIAEVERWALAFLAFEVVDAPDVLAAVVPPKPAPAKKPAAKKAAKS